MPPVCSRSGDTETNPWRRAKFVPSKGYLRSNSQLRVYTNGDLNSRVPPTPEPVRDR